MTGEPPVTYAAAFAEARAALDAGGVETAGFDARLLLANAAGLDLAALIARSDEPVPDLAHAAFRHHVQRRAGGEPVARILGEVEFRGLALWLNDQTLVPRPETETLVEAVLQETRGSRPDLTLCDLGTGSGAVAVALLKELPDARAVATDISDGALAAARANAERHGVLGRLTLRKVAFHEGPAGPFDVVVSNPPYVRRSVIAGLQREVRDHDPRIALDGGGDGLDAYRAILARIGNLVGPGGLVALEIGFDQGAAVASLCGRAGLDGIALIRDIAGHDRVVTARRAAALGPCDAIKKALGEVG